MGELGYFALFIAQGAIVLGLVLGPLGQALGRRLSGEKKPVGDGLSTGEMAAERIAQLESRVQELEERQDFAERMLAQGSGERALPAEGRPT